MRKIQVRDKRDMLSKVESIGAFIYAKIYGCCGDTHYERIDNVELSNYNSLLIDVDNGKYITALVTITKKGGVSNGGSIHRKKKYQRCL